MKKCLLEICVFSLDSAIKASRAGADRLELCNNPLEGGTTPHHAFIKAAVEKTGIPVFPIIRPRGGDFCFSDDEFAMMMDDILSCKATGCKGIATGILLEDNRVDEKRMRKIVEWASPMGVTFIRAFDLTPDPAKALQSVINAGCERILTSGQAQKAESGLSLIRELNNLAKGKISIMPGSGVRPENIKVIIEETGVHEIHSSARIFVPNKSSKVDELGLGQPVSYDEKQVAKMRQIINDLV
jgi:copper homeostasis protein